MRKLLKLITLTLLTILTPGINQAAEPMDFFITSIGLGDGANLGGLAGADAHCKALASEVGAGDRDWKAFLSTEEADKRGVSARNRIGDGPWHNAKGELIAANIIDLLLYNRTILKSSTLSEKGEEVNGRGDKPNEHDILTGSQDDGTAYFPDDQDRWSRIFLPFRR